MKRIAILCAGRGSYTEKTLRSLPADHPFVRRADELRARYELAPLTELDAAQKFRPDVHLRPANVSPLIWLVTLLDAARCAGDTGGDSGPGKRGTGSASWSLDVLPRPDARGAARVVAVAGNSMGWYSALAVAGALDFDDGFRLVQEMALLQEEVVGGGQMIHPIVGEDWRVDPERVRVVDEAIASSEGQAFPSIALGGYAVLAASDAGLAHLQRALPPAQLGKNRYPFKLVGHGPYHTPLVLEVAERARERLANLDWRRPRATLVDGRGARFTPWSADLAELCDYTLGRQVVEPYDFTHSVRVVLREHAPDELVLPGPGNTLGGVCGQILVGERWRGVTSRADFEAMQSSARPLVCSMQP